MNKLVITQALIVEGRYDASRLADVVDGTILTTDGFAIFRDKKMQTFFKTLAKAQGLILLTDPDAAGFRIRHFITGLVGAQYVLQAYVPAVSGKERRKAQPGKEGLLGVEGISTETILCGLQTALAGIQQQGNAVANKAQEIRSIQYSDLYEWGLSGTTDCAEHRRRFLDAIGLPPRLSKKELLQVLNTLYTYDTLCAQVKMLL